MGDCGELYPCQSEVSKIMHQLVTEADFIFPNPTEVALLLGLNPKELNIALDGSISKFHIMSLAVMLFDKFTRTSFVITSVADMIVVCLFSNF
jgi:pyridoxal/pyridoxine/pyridoxamine kinase